MSDEARLVRIEKALDDLCSALQRRGTEQDGNWGWPAFHEDLTHIRLSLAVQPKPVHDAT